MKASEAARLIAAAVPKGRGTWADLGAGDGTFTRALVELLEPGSTIYAVDRDARSIASLGRWVAKSKADVFPVVADFSRPFDLPELASEATLDGILLANALHFVRDADQVLARVVTRLRRGGRVVLVEYDRRAASRWVPYPIPPSRLAGLAAAAGLSAPAITGRRPSAFGGDLYVAAADRLEGGVLG